MLSATLAIDPHFTIGTVNRRLFGSFVEHLGRCVYDGIYEPGHPSAGEDGFREDVIELVRELGVSTIRYPGGNFVSGYRWEDGVGPRAERPSRLDLAWHSTESNAVGLDEFVDWTRRVGSEPMYAVNLGTRGIQEALDVLEYANLRSGTRLSEWRAQNGHAEPHDIRMWCLGNEMDGPWQLGASTPDEYGRLASKTAKAMRQVDPEIELVACGSSNARMPQFGEWERVVLGHTYDDVDFISCHAYYEEKDGDLGSFLASAVDMDRFIDTVVATADHVKAVRRSDKTINISFDEWNVWYNTRYRASKMTGIEGWPEAPRLLEDIYSVADAVVVGNLLISLLKHADRVTAASLAQLVNVIAPIMTEPGGPAWRQTIFYPFAITSRLARGASLAVALDTEEYATAQYGTVPLVDVAATHDPETGAVALFLVNRSIDQPLSVRISLASLGQLAVSETHTIADEDVTAANTLEHQDRVVPSPNDSVVIADGVIEAVLPPVSWTAIALVRA